MKTTVWTATQELDADYIHHGGKVLCVLDMISEGDDFLQMEATIENGNIYVYGTKWEVCEEGDTEKELIAQALNKLKGRD
jgi:hypothetical protein|tara:strand:+ start:875 stop:1114 length:240 start_codon:yes stop_codon:yes gene_type:complete